MQRLSCLAFTPLLLALACDQGDTSVGGFDDDGCDGAETGDEPDPSGFAPIAVDCSFSFEGVQQDATVLPIEIDEPPTELAFGDLKVGLNLSDSEFEGRTFSITVYKEDSSVLSTAIYQMLSSRLPVNEFVGQHGFTGLNWVKDPAVQENLQYACFARDPNDPPISWEE
jgi:hypothetical protein